MDQMIQTPELSGTSPICVRTYHADSGDDVARRLHCRFFESTWQAALPGDPHRQANRIWVAEVDGRAVGSLAASHADLMVARLEWLYLEPEWREQATRQLVEKAVRYCREHGYLKVVLRNLGPVETDLEVLSRCGLQHARRRRATTPEDIEFYIDLYHRGDRQDQRRSARYRHPDSTCEPALTETETE